MPRLNDFQAIFARRMLDVKNGLSLADALAWALDDILEEYGGEGGGGFLSGARDPLPEDGVDGDFWINTDSWFIFGPKAGGTWPAGVSLVGPAGEDGYSLLMIESRDDEPTEGLVNGRIWLLGGTAGWPMASIVTNTTEDPTTVASGVTWFRSDLG